MSAEVGYRERALKTLTDFFAPWPSLQAAPGLVSSSASETQAAYRGGCGDVEKNLQKCGDGALRATQEEVAADCDWRVGAAFVAHGIRRVLLSGRMLSTNVEDSFSFAIFIVISWLFRRIYQSFAASGMSKTLVMGAP
ncbi:hypothetical protein VUJ49_02645 [Pseudomonas berkeleyensis]|uniref:Uncharacterized protein n=1 Tax=Pseudomonas berkeleyensis TaxID=2726956 RepID=A0A7G5DQF2_9PSED|nr:hypothetical protein [Pseudomonas berkeleyensis]QMV63977.1 hypothetical protein HS968_02635 [Pseudomonas berkeleyensis]WSO39443.1 hypothetical protein VUJ49_02645 [Pseudomonas berkeleyensis]